MKARPDPGLPLTVAAGLRVLLAPNPGPMTHWGTNTFILGEGRVAVIDPGPDDPAHFDALLRAVAGEVVTHVLVTHAHADHSPLARRLAERTGAPVMAFGPPDAGRSDTMQRLAKAGLAGGGEGVDREFRPDATLSEGDEIKSDGWKLRVHHTPGHFAGHLAFGTDEFVVTGDHVMDWSSSLVSPPDGDLTAFMATSDRLAAIGAPRFFPGHGGAIDDPGGRLGWLTEHRRRRETAILNALGPRSRGLSEITAAAYTDVPAEVLPAAARNAFAHLVDLVERNLAVAEPVLGLRAGFRLP